MDNIFSQPKIIYKICFNIFYKHVDFFENFSQEDILCTTAFELESKTIEAQENDIWKFELYFSKKPQKRLYTKNLQDFSSQNNLEILGNIEFITIEDKDWVAEYHKQLVPINIGKFFISSYEQSNQCPESSLAIILEASRAFGTGDHATTSGCLNSIEKLSNFSPKTIYDIGTGSGILSFAAAKLWPEAKILACDIEEISVSVAKFNQTFNNSKIHFYQNSPENLKIPQEYNMNFDLIISNILAKPLINLAPYIAELLNQRARLILSGFLDYQMADVIDAYRAVGLEVEKVINKNTWITLIMKL